MFRPTRRLPLERLLMLFHAAFWTSCLFMQYYEIGRVLLLQSFPNFRCFIRVSSRRPSLVSVAQKHREPKPRQPMADSAHESLLAAINALNATIGAQQAQIAVITATELKSQEELNTFYLMWAGTPLS